MSEVRKENKDRVGTILVAEDSEPDAFILKKAYSATELPHAMRFVHDGQEVIHYLQGKPPYDDRLKSPMPDLILLDLKMPRVDGFDVLRWIQLSGIESPPVVVLSGSELEGDRKRAFQLGAREFYAKRADITKTMKFLKEVCERWLGNHSLKHPVHEASRENTQ